MDFSIEESGERIPNAKTKSYFKEVISSYTIGNYRSAVVMLYSVVICDLIYKMKELVDIYDDSSAKEILEKIAKKQKDSCSSSDWEMYLVKLIQERMNLLSLIDCKNIEGLKNHRNMSAHPVITNNYDLYTPNKETVRSDIRNMLESVLMKDALLSKEIITSLIEDIASKKNIFKQYNILKKYLNSKYFPFMQDAVKEKLFRSLWKFVFKLDDDKCEENRLINFYSLRILHEENKSLFKTTIQKEPRYFSSISSDDKIMFCLFYFLCTNKDVYDMLDNSAKTIINSHYNSDINPTEPIKAKRILYGKILGWFVEDEYSIYIQKLEDVFRDSHIYSEGLIEVLDIILKVGIERNQKSETLIAFINIFGYSLSFVDSGERYHIFIDPFIQYFDGEQLKILLNVSDGNKQIYQNYRIDFDEIKEACFKKLGGDFSFIDYPHFKERLFE